MKLVDRIETLDLHQKLLLRAICEYLQKTRKKTFLLSEAHLKYANLAKQKGVEPHPFSSYGFKYAFDALQFAGLVKVQSKKRDAYKLLVDPKEILNVIEES